MLIRRMLKTITDNYINVTYQEITMIEHEGAASRPGPDPKAVSESHAETVSQPGGFKNDPDDPTSPNECIERSRKALRQRVADLKK